MAPALPPPVMQEHNTHQPLTMGTAVHGSNCPSSVCLQVASPSIQDWQDDKQADCASRLLLPGKPTDGNIRWSTAQLTDEPERISPQLEVTAQYVHLDSSLLVTVDLLLQHAMLPCQVPHVELHH